jgi:hypothetical protein
MRALALALLVTGCAIDPCADKAGTCIALEIKNGPGVPSTVNQIGVRMLSGFTFGEGDTLRPAVAKPTTLPAFLAILPPDTFAGGDFSLQVSAFVGGERIATTTADSSIELRAKKKLTVLLTGSTPDDGGAPDDGPAGPCDPVKQTGCAATDKCTADINGGALSCVPDRNMNLGTECSPAGTDPVPATDPCKKGLWCVPDTQNGLFFSCRQFCSVDADCTQPPVISADNKGHCLIKITSANKHEFCSLACDPTNTDGVAGGCVNGTACRVNVLTNLEYTNCESDRGAQGEGAACPCQDGLTCFKNICRKPCLITTPICLSGTTCTPPFGGAKPYGFCCPGGNC